MSRRLPTLLSALLLAAVLLAAPGAAPAQGPMPARVLTVDRIVAVVNDEVITQFDLTLRTKLAVAQLSRQGTALPPAEILERQVLERMISDRVQLQLARETGIRIDDGQLEKILSRIAAENKMTLPQFREAIERDGMAFTRFREDLRDEVLISRLREREVDSRVVVTESEIDNFLKNSAAQGSNDELNLAHILVRVPEGASPEQLAERRARAEQALGQVKAGTDFGQVAAAFSDAPDALKGGVMGARPTDRWPTLFADAARSLKVGEVSPVLRSPAGFHIIRIVDRRVGGNSVLVQQTRARHILIRVNELVPEADANQRLRGLKERIENGAPFGELARLHSDDGSAARGGELGWISPGDTVPAFERAMDQLKVNEVSDPVRSDFGVHLIQVLERRSEDLSNERQRLGARQALRARKADETYQEWVRQIRDRAFVNLRLEER
ncbi:MAG: peptidylprolyl isomerase [Rhodocyclaceae bacterium]|nr:peptidylprolyl isomerase [Rhodocyclaceae bacterium]MCA3074456.1 peptidylprolyl isomerase [Rhodocyclaceae bacterium]MCA3089824.1 peptidylprolyl isomerase [Rhodocyclaceae bacterium]MCA3093472.1 peptidylprolyl isomerase [Rhodocyclaceae bacterium]MCA3096289.1 peptidylprolyl isomerase [Rhodocyclaceae bacterium]